jgi:uncharacterized protein (TIGR02246 family)
MNIHFLRNALLGLAVSFALPTFAQLKDTVDPEIAQQIGALVAKFDEAFNRNDASGVAAFYTENGVNILPWGGAFHGRPAIEKGFAGVFRSWRPSNQISRLDRLKVVGNEVRPSGRWSHTTYPTGSAPNSREGSFTWIMVREGDTWKIRRSTFTDTTSDSVN